MNFLLPTMKLTDGLLFLTYKKKSIYGWNSRYGSLRIDAKVRDEGIYTLFDSEMQTICCFLIYSTPDGQNKIEVNLKNDTVWLNLDQIAELFDRNKSTISRHIRNIFEQGELEQNAVVAKNATTATDGKIYQVDYYNLDMIISVGYRVNSLRGTHFRMWATQVLREYIVKGFAMDDERLKRGGGGNYFDELHLRSVVYDLY